MKYKIELAGGGGALDMPQQQIEYDIPNTYDYGQDVTTAHVEVDADISHVADELAGMSPFEWFIVCSIVTGALLLVTCFIRFTPFSKGLSDMFLTLSNIAKGKTKNKK